MNIHERDQLILDNAGVARRIANSFAGRCPGWIRREDLQSAAMAGLTEAAGAFDASRCQPFAGFASFRISGAIRDELRRGDILPRRKRALARKIAAIKARPGGPQSDAGIAAELGISAGEYLAQVVGLDARVDPDADYERAIADEPSPYALAARQQLLELVTRSSVHLTPRDALLLGLYYRDDLSFREIGERLEISSSRACTLVARAVRRLRELVDAPVVQEAA